MKKVEKMGKYFYFLLFLLATIILFCLGKIYLKHIDNASNLILAKNEIQYIETNKKLNTDGLYSVNIKDNVLKFIKNRKIENLTYKIDGEELYIDLKITKEKDKSIINITKIIDKKHNIKAQINFNDVENIQFRTGNNNLATALKISTKFGNEYIVFIDDTYYFLGKDIKNLTYVDNQFYYVTYNPNYKILENEKECSKEVIDKIDGFNYKHYYYKYGKINFLKDFYQKLPTKSYTVKNKCDDLKLQNSKLDKEV